MGEDNGPKFKCAACGREFRWKPELAGKKAKCKCGAAISVPQSPPPRARPAPAAPAPAPAVEHDPFEDPFDDAAIPEPISPPPASRRGASASGAAKPPPPLPPSAPQQIACPVCNTPALPTAVICLSCGYNFRTGVRPAGGGRMTTRAGSTGGIAADTYAQAAKFSWMAPIAAILLGCCTVGARQAGPGVGLAIAGLQLLLILGGMGAGIFALVGSKRYGPEGILVPAISGIVLNGLIIGLNIYLFSMLLSGRGPFGSGTARGGGGGGGGGSGGGSGSSAVAPRTKQEMQKAGEDAFKEAGWLGILQYRGAVITLVTIPDHTPIAQDMLSNLATPVSIVVVAVDNTRGGDAFSIDPTGATVHFTNKTSAPMPDVVQVFQSAKTDPAKAVQQFSPPFEVAPGRQLVGKFMFLPPKTDPSTISHVSLKIDGKPVNVPGRFMTADEKQAAMQGGGIR